MNIKRMFSVLFLLVLSCLIIHPVAAQQIVIPFEVGETLLQNVTMDQMTRQYQINGLRENSLFLLAVSDDYTNSPAITLTDNSTNQTVAMVHLDVSGMCLRLAPGMGNYTLSVTNENLPVASYYGLMLMQNDPNAFTCNDDAMRGLADAVSNAADEGAMFADGTSMSFNFGDDSDGGDNGSGGNPGGSTGCEATSGSLNQGVNVRETADPFSTIIGNLGVGEIVPVLGATNGGDWLLIDDGGVMGFAANGVIQIGGDCSQIPGITIDGMSITGTGEDIDLGVLLNLEEGSGGSANVGDSNLNLDLNPEGGVNVGTNSSGLTVNTNVDENGNPLISVENDGDPLVNVNGNTGQGGDPLLEVEVPDAETGATVGGGEGETCLNVLGIPITC